MPDRDALAMWRTRVRWRLRGAWQWPTFAVLTVVDGVLLSRLPFDGEGTGIVPALLLACFFNLVVVAVLAPVGGRLWRRRRPTVPREVAADQAGTVALLGLTVVLVAAGIAHRPAVQERRDDFRAQLAAAREWVAHQAPAEFQAGLLSSDTWRQGPTLYRTCFPGSDPRRPLCLVVRTDEGVPVVRPDRDRRPNAEVAGPDNPARAAR